MSTRHGKSPSPNRPVPPISHAEREDSPDAPDSASPSEPNFEKYADLLRKSLEPATSDWSHRDLAEMLLREMTYRPEGADDKELIAHHRLTRSHAKEAIGGKVEGVSPEFAFGIYYVAICRAWLENGAWITSLTREGVAEGLRFVLQYQWAKEHQELSDKLSELARGLAERGDPKQRAH